MKKKYMHKDSQVYAKLKNARTSVKKSRVVAELIRGLPVLEAKKVLSFHGSKAAKIFLRVLKSAEANAINNTKLSQDSLFVSDAQVYAGPTMKRGRIVARSRLSPILKRTSHIVVGLSSHPQVLVEKKGDK